MFVAFFIDNNMKLLETQKELALSNPIFIQNDEIRRYAVYFQVTISVFIFIISYLKPWKKKRDTSKQ